MLILFMNYYAHEYITRNNDTKRRKQKLDISREKGTTISNKHE